MNFVMDGRTVAPDLPSFVIAEAGVNHNGSIELAHRLVDVAAEAKANAVKFQLFKTDLLVHPSADKAPYQIASTGSDTPQAEMLRGLELSHADVAALAEHARQRGLMFLTTAFDLESLAYLVTIGVPAHKVPSGEINNRLMLRAVARSRLPVILSTGMSSLAETAAAVDELRRFGSTAIALLQCTSAYPADPADANLRVIPALAAAFDLVVGYSDHTPGAETAVAALALGARIFEKHVTLDKGMSGPDHQASADPAEFASYVAALRRVEAALGTGIKAPAAAEAEVRKVARRGLYVRRAVAKDAEITEEDLVALRPCKGISPDLLDLVVGRRAARDLPPGGLLEWSDLL